MLASNTVLHRRYTIKGNAKEDTRGEETPTQSPTPHPHQDHEEAEEEKASTTPNGTKAERRERKMATVKKKAYTPFPTPHQGGAVGEGVMARSHCSASSKAGMGGEEDDVCQWSTRSGVRAYTAVRDTSVTSWVSFPPHHPHPFWTVGGVEGR